MQLLAELVLNGIRNPKTCRWKGHSSTPKSQPTYFELFQMNKIGDSVSFDVPDAVFAANFISSEVLKPELCELAHPNLAHLKIGSLNLGSVFDKLHQNYHGDIRLARVDRSVGQSRNNLYMPALKRPAAEPRDLHAQGLRNGNNMLKY